MENVLTLLAAVLGGSGATKLLDYLLATRAAKRAALREDQAEQRDRDSTGWTRWQDCEKRADELEQRCETLEKRLRTVEGNTPAYLARWLKDQKKRVVWLNDLAYIMLFAPLGWSRDEVLDKNFEELLGEGAHDAIVLIDELDRAALADPGKVYSIILQLHPNLPAMVILKVAMVTPDGLLRYEGTSYVPVNLGDNMGPLRQHMARVGAAMSLLHGDPE